MPPKREAPEEDTKPVVDKKPRVKKSGKGQAWTKEEVRQLWAALDIIPTKISWDAVADKVEGRNKISCRDKWLKDILPKLQEFIESRGE